MLKKNQARPAVEDIGIIELIRREYPLFTHSMRKVADYVLQNPRSIVYLPITELSDLCGVSDFSVIKFCRGLGLTGYQELKLMLSKEFVRPMENIHEGVQEGDKLADIADKLLTSHTTTLASTRGSLDLHKVQLTVDAMSKAKRIEFYGMGTSAGVAKDAYHKFFRLGFHCRFIEDSHMQAMSAALLEPGDVALAISNSGSSKEVIDALKQARQAGATTVCITSYPNAPINKIADIRLITKSPENLYRGEPMEIRFAQLYVLDLLFVSVAIGRKELFIENLEKTRKALTNKKL